MILLQTDRTADGGVTLTFGEFHIWVATDRSLISATGVQQLRVIYYSICLVRWILIRCLPPLVDAFLASYPAFSSTKSYSHAYYDLCHFCQYLQQVTVTIPGSPVNIGSR